MLDIEPGLDEKLRSLYGVIETEEPPAGVTRFTMPEVRSGHRVLGSVAVVAGVAVIAAAIGLFATELHAHRGSGSPTPSTQPAASPPAPTSRSHPTTPISSLLGPGGNLVTNGGFEEPVRLVAPYGNDGNLRSLPGWATVQGVWVGSAALGDWPALEGNQYLLITGTVRAHGEISQRVHTTPGDTYRLAFLRGATDNCSGGDAYLLDVSWNGFPVAGFSSTLVAPSKSRPEPSGDEWYLDVDPALVATATTTTISFAGGEGCGAALDDVSLQQVAPAP